MFLHEKHSLFHRLRPEESEEIKVTILLNQIGKSLRKYIRSADPQSYSQLLTIAMKLESDDQEPTEMCTSRALPIKAPSRESTARPRTPMNPDLLTLLEKVDRSR